MLLVSTDFCSDLHCRIFTCVTCFGDGTYMSATVHKTLRMCDTPIKYLV